MYAIVPFTQIPLTLTMSAKSVSILDSLLSGTISKSLLICFGVNQKVCREISLIYSLIYIQKILLH